MLWGGIRNRVIERMAEYRGGAAEVSAKATLTDATVYSRITDTFKELLGDIAEIDPTKVCSITTVNYTLNAESVTLAAALKWRPIHTVERQLNDLVSYEPLEKVTQWQDSVSRQWDSINYVPVDSSYAWRVEKDQLYVMPKPTQALVLRVRYLPDIVDITSADAAATPDYIPSEHHPYLALKTAMSFIGETSGNSALDRELAQKEAKFIKWASQSAHKAGPTFVAEPE